VEGAAQVHSFRSGDQSDQSAAGASLRNANTTPRRALIPARQDEQGN
jgi:hypothetical protein